MDNGENDLFGNFFENNQLKDILHSEHSHDNVDINISEKDTDDTLKFDDFNDLGIFDDGDGDIVNNPTDEFDLFDGFGDIFADDDLSFTKDKGRTVVKFPGYYIDYLGINPNTILAQDPLNIINLMKVFYNRKKLVYIKQNIEGYEIGNVYHEGFIDLMMERYKSLPDESKDTASEVIGRFRSNWSEISNFIDTLTSSPSNLTINKNLEDLLFSNHNGKSPIILDRLRDYSKVGGLLTEFINNPNIDVIDFIVEKVKSADLITKYLESKYDSDIKKHITDTIAPFKNQYKYEYNLSLLDNLGFISSIFGKEHLLFKENESISKGEKDSLDTIKRYNLIAKLINIKSLTNKETGQLEFCSFT